MDYQFLTKEEQADILRTRLKAIESDHLQQEQVRAFAVAALKRVKTKQEKLDLTTHRDNAERAIRQLETAYETTIAAYGLIKPSGSPGMVPPGK